MKHPKQWGDGGRAVALNTPTAQDREILRRLGARKAARALEPDNAERRKAWLALDAGRDDRVMVLAEGEGVRDRTSPLPESDLECTDPWARKIEKRLRAELYETEVLRDDHVLEPFVECNWQVTIGDCGLRPIVHQGGDAEHMGSRSWEPPCTDLARDLPKLHFRDLAVDREGTFEELARLESVFGGILPARIRGNFYWTMGLTHSAIDLVGLDRLMLLMYDDPEGLHRLMTFLRDDHLRLADWLEREGLYTLNNENDYIGSGSRGYTADLPARPPVPGERVRMRDLWVLLESQETVGVGPEQFEEFIFPYQLSLAGRFGKVYYGCCEPVHSRWHILQRLPNLARVSVSPWADQQVLAAAFGRDIVFSRKPSPTLISTPRFDEDLLRNDLRETLEIARDCRLEIIMKDVHTLSNEPDRLARWVQLAREEIAKSR
jgi:hypothetical protein